MRLTDVLLDAKVRARLGLDDEQIKKIQELAEKGRVEFGYQQLKVKSYVSFARAEQPLAVFFDVSTLSDEKRAELLKVLTPAQREALERLSGIKLDKK
jgi:hypothetical protein